MTVEHLAGRLRTALAGKRITERRMFGGICFMLNGNMTVAASRNGLLVRVGREGNDAALKRPGVRPMIRRGKPLAGYIYVDETGTRTSKQLATWAETALAHVATLPPKTRRARPKPVTSKRRRTLDD